MQTFQRLEVCQTYWSGCCLPPLIAMTSLSLQCPVSKSFCAAAGLATLRPEQAGDTQTPTGSAAAQAEGTRRRLPK